MVHSWEPGGGDYMAAEETALDVWGRED